MLLLHLVISQKFQGIIEFIADTIAVREYWRIFVLVSFLHDAMKNW